MKKLFLTGFVALGLLATSCSEDDNNVDPQDGLNGYLTLTLNSPSMGTKTDAGTPGREAGYGNEVKINDVTVVLTDGSDLITGVIPTTMESTNTTKKFSIMPGTHKIYTLVNSSGISTALTTGANIEQVISSATLADITSGFKGGSFFMTNSRHSGQASAGVNIVIAAGEEKIASVTLDRVAAKIVDKTTAPTVSLPADVIAVVNNAEVLGFVPLNVNKDFNMIQSWGKSNVGGTNDPVATDVLFTPVTNYLAPVTDYKEKTNVNGVDVWENKSTAGMFVDSMYTTENRPPILLNAQGILTAKRNNTTGVIYRVQAKLNAADCSTFYSYNGKAYPNLTALSAIFGTDLTSKPVLELRALGINVYEDGIMYYTYFVKDPNTNYQLDSKDYFGVFRNSVYRLTINNINNLGDDVPDDNKEPEETIDPDNAYLKVDLTVNDWVLNEIGLDF